MESGGKGVISVGGVIAVLGLALVAFGTGHAVGQGETGELEGRLALCSEVKEELTERLAELDEAQVTEVQEQRRLPELPAGEPVATTTAFELEMTPGQTVELPGAGVAVRVAEIRVEDSGRGVVFIISRGGLEYTTFLAGGEQTEVGDVYVEVKEIVAGRVKLYVEV